MFDMQQHLESRGFDRSLYSGVFVEDESVTLALWNLSGQMVGYQTYSPLKPKAAAVNPRDQRYFTYASRNSQGGASLACWGLEITHQSATNIIPRRGSIRSMSVASPGFGRRRRARKQSDASRRLASMLA